MEFDVERFSWGTKFFYPIFFLQRLGISAIIVFSYEWPIAQIVSILMIEILMVIYLICLKPYKRTFQKMTSPIDEIALCASIIIFLILLIKGKNMSDSTFSIYGFIIVGILSLSIFRTMIYTLI